MNMVRLIYASRMAKGCGTNELLQILDISRKNNKKMGVTGALCYSGTYFLQCLEGPREAVTELYRRIVSDSRNTDITLLGYSDIFQRDYANWSMAYIKLDDVDKTVLMKYSAQIPFDPFSMSAEQAAAFVHEISQLRERERPE